VSVRSVARAAFVLAFGCAAPPAGTALPGAGPASPPRRSPPPNDPALGRCDYRVKAPEAAPFSVEVRARCRGRPVSGFAPDVPELDAFVKRGELTTPEPGATELVYTVDLGGVAAKFDRYNVAARFGTSLLAPASSFLFTPEPSLLGVPIEVGFEEAPGFATGLRRNAEGYGIESHELRVATYTVFGAREVRTLGAPGVLLRMALLDGRIALGVDRMARWVEAAYRAVASFYAQAPDSEILVVIAPLPKARGVRFGQLLPESAPGIVMLVGEETTESDLGDDWMLVHELFHVGTPSYGARSGWFDEGLATYFEPLVRARAGLGTEEKVWQEFATEMPRGLDALTGRGLGAGESRDDIYWGGGLFCLLADVEARKRTNGKKGLEDGLRAVLRAGGNSSVVWSLDDTLQAMDAGIGEPVLGELAKRHIAKGAPVDLGRLFQELGIVPTGPKPPQARSPGQKRVRFDETAPLAAVRRSILTGRAW
jgi:hypothetical protein